MRWRPRLLAADPPELLVYDEATACPYLAGREARAEALGYGPLIADVTLLRGRLLPHDSGASGFAFVPVPRRGSGALPALAGVDVLAVIAAVYTLRGFAEGLGEFRRRRWN